jgi:DNA-binding NarL/FixJ family response regulator
VVNGYLHDAKSAAASGSLPLSDREREVLQLIAEGVNTKEIASRLRLSVKTIETHRKRMMDRLGLHSVAGLTKFAVREGLTSLEK